MKSSINYEITRENILRYQIFWSNNIKICKYPQIKTQISCREAEKRAATRPEAAEGGPIGLVKEGDVIFIDIPNKTIELKVDIAELESRKKDFTPLQPKITTGYLGRYAKMVTSASTGAVFKD